MKKFWDRHSLSIVLIAILLGQMIIYFLLGYPDWIDEQQALGLPTDMSSFMVYYWSEIMVSVLADTYGAVLLVILTKRLYEKDSAESKK